MINYTKKILRIWSKFYKR